MEFSITKFSRCNKAHLLETFHSIDFPNNGCGLSTSVAYTYAMLYKYGQETQKLCTIGFNTVEVTGRICR